MRDFTGLLKLADAWSYAVPAAGIALAAAPIVLSSIFKGRGKALAKRFMDVYQKGLVKGRRALAGRVSGHIRSTGAQLPRYRTVPANAIMNGSISKKGFVPVFAKSGPGDVIARQMSSALNPGGMSDFTSEVTRSAINNMGPMYSPNTFIRGKSWKDAVFGRYFSAPGEGRNRLTHEFIGLPPVSGEYYNPKVLLHELGHAKDAATGGFHSRNGRFTPSFVDWLKDTYYGFAAPDKTRLLKNEIKAWDNARIMSGDELREAALNAYRNAARAKSAGRVALPVAIGGGAGLAYLASRNSN